MTADASDHVRCPCNDCGHWTSHDLLAQETVHRIEEWGDDSAEWWDDTFAILRCRGCSALSVKHTYIYLSEADPEITYYPPRLSRRPPRWRGSLPQDLRAVLDETYIALTNNCGRLATMGARTLVDMLMLAKLGDIGGFAVKLNALRDQGFLSANNRDVLETALDAGSATIHRGFKPADQDVEAVMDIVEHLLEAIYVLPRVGTRLKSAIPPRSPKP